MHGLAALALGLLFSAPSLEDVNRAVEDVLADSGIQTEYPGEEATPRPRETPPASRPLRPRSRSSIAPVGSRFLSTLLWVLAGVVALLVVVWAVRELQGTARRARIEESAAVAAPRAPPGDAPLGNAQALAAEGRYEEAVHLLLLHALHGIERDGGKVSSQTSREVIRAATLEEASRDAVLGLVGAVELSLFGGRRVDEAGYRISVEHYRRFLAARA